MGTGSGSGSKSGARGRRWSGNGNGKGSGGELGSARWERGRERGRKREQHNSGDRNGGEDGIGEGGGEAKKHKKPHKTCRRHVGNGGDFGGKREKRRKERVGPVAANPDNLEINKEAGGGAQGTQGLSNNRTTSGESVSPFSRLIRGFRNKYH